MARPEVSAKQAQDAPIRKNKPVEKFREGPIHVSIWENRGVNGAFRTASLEIRFRKNNQWRSASSYGMADLAYLEIAAKHARARIENWQRSNRTRPVQAKH